MGTAEDLLQLIDGALQDADATLTELQYLREQLDQHKSMLSENLKTTPRDCIDNLRHHCIERIKQHKHVEFFSSTEYSHYSAVYKTMEKRWIVQVSCHNAYQTDKTDEEMIDLIKDATMFAENMY